MIPTPEGEIDVWAQCQNCLDHFNVTALDRGLVFRLVTTARVRRRGRRYYHRCGGGQEGELRFFGRLPKPLE
jgi:hypothetical protein